MIRLIQNDIHRKDAYFIIFFILMNLRFYNCALAHPLRYVFFISDILFSFYFLYCFLKYKEHNKNLVTISMSILYLIFWGSAIIGQIGEQNIFYWFRTASGSYLIFGFYYYLQLKRINPTFLFRLVLYMTIGYMIITILCYIQFPNCWFGIAGWVKDAVDDIISDGANRGILRFVLPCKMYIIFWIFYVLSRFKMNMRNLFILFVLVVYLLLIGNRFPLFTCALCSLYMILFSKNIRLKYKIQLTIFGILLLSIVVLIPFTNNIINSLLNYTSNQYESIGNENIRILSATYFFTEFNGHDLFHIIVGNGIITNDHSAYGLKIAQLQNIGYFSSDVGFCSIYIQFGIIGLLALALWLAGVLTIKIPKHLNYIKVFMFFIVLSMIAGGYWFQDLILIAILTYIMVYSHNKMIIQKKK